ncbi:hypothetical protein LXL04_030065 [Taraxacum kok-saghyz]
MLHRLGIIDGTIDQGAGSATLMAERHGILRDLADIDKVRSLDAAQKTKVVWSVEGDENTAFFHGVIKRKRRQMTVRGLAVGGEWITEPNAVKRAFFHYYADKFQQFDGVPFSQRSSSFRTIGIVKKCFCM